MRAAQAHGSIGHLVLLLLLLGMVGSSGCAEMFVTLFGVGSGVGSGTGTSYFLESIVYKTFAASVERLRAATFRTLKRMDMKVKESQTTQTGRKIVAVARDRTIEIELERLTPKTSRMRVNVKKGWFFRDRTTAEEIISQTEQTLDESSRALEATPMVLAQNPKKEQKRSSFE